MQGNHHFHLANPALQGIDKRPRNAFGVLLGFGQAYAAHYRALDKRQTKRKRTARNGRP